METPYVYWYLQEKLVQTAGYERLFSVLISIGPPSKELLHALLAMAAEEEPSEQSKLKVIS
jgi:hypothetical protein